MKEPITIPSLGESVTTAVLAAWLKENGDYVEEGADIFELESDKASMAVPSPFSGTISIMIEEGTEVKVGQTVAEVDTDAEKPIKEESRKQKDAYSPRSPSKPVETPAAPKDTTNTETFPAETPSESDSSAATSPAVRKLMAEHGLTPASVKGSGEGGRIVKGDVLKAASGEAGKRQSALEAGEAENGEVLETAPAQKRVPMSRIRKTIAENLVRSRQNSAHLTTFNEVNMSRIMEIRQSYREKFMETHGIKLGFMSFFIKASCTALKKFPKINSYIENDEIVYNNYYDIGVAVSTERGLLVPVIRDADRLGIDELEKSLSALAEKARNRKLAVGEMTGGTFTITNGGVFGSMLSTPIPTPPQSGILGMHAIQQRPVVEKGEIVARPMMYLAFTYDHRIVDGKEAIGFLITIKNIIEEPEALLLNV